MGDPVSVEAALEVSLRHAPHLETRQAATSGWGTPVPCRCCFDFCDPSWEWRAALTGMGHIWSPGGGEGDSFTMSHANDTMQIITDICVDTKVETKNNKQHIQRGRGLFYYIKDCLEKTGWLWRSGQVLIIVMMRRACQVSVRLKHIFKQYLAHKLPVGICVFMHSFLHLQCHVFRLNLAFWDSAVFMSLRLQRKQNLGSSSEMCSQLKVLLLKTEQRSDQEPKWIYTVPKMKWVLIFNI